MPKNGIQDLRNHLFAALESLQDKNSPMDIDRAKAVCQVAEKLIDTAKVEVAFLQVTGEAVQAGGFFKPQLPQLPQGPQRQASKPNGKLAA